MILGASDKPSLTEAIEHFGVKGMKWGVRRDPRNVASRARDRATRKAAAADRNREIDAARSRLRSGETRATFKTAKRQFKEDKKTLGRREARKKLYAARLKKNSDIETANMIKTGGEEVGVILGIVGAAAISSIRR